MIWKTIQLDFCRSLLLVIICSYYLHFSLRNILRLTEPEIMEPIFVIILTYIIEIGAKIIKPLDKWVCDYCAMGKSTLDRDNLLHSFHYARSWTKCRGMRASYSLYILRYKTRKIISRNFQYSGLLCLIFCFAVFQNIKGK